MLDALAKHSNLQVQLFVCGKFADNPIRPEDLA
jgi:hypothetical protein